MADSLEALYKFNSYSMEKRADLLLQDGAYLRSRNRLDCDVYLFWMGSFYGELWLKQGTTELHNIRSFVYKDALGWYPELVRMEEERLNELKGKRIPGLDGLTFSP